MARPKKWTPERIAELQKDFEEYYKDEDKLFLQEFCVDNGYSPQLISELSAMSETFSEAVKRTNQFLEQRLVKAALKQKYNPVFTMFVLKNKHGWVDKQEIKTENRNVNVDLASQVKDMTDEQLRESIRDLVSD